MLEHVFPLHCIASKKKSTLFTIHKDELLHLKSTGVFSGCLIQSLIIILVNKRSSCADDDIIDYSY